ncbi:MAG: NUDIX domain-containing protein [Rubrobacteraceae bacterium]
MAKYRGYNGIDFGIRVGAVVERDGNILLVRHQKPDSKPYWVLPGGRLEPGETIPQCAERELAEETGLAVRFSEVLYVSEFLREGRHTVDVTVRATADSEDEARLGSDPEVEEGSEPTLKELRWVEVSGLRDIELLPSWIQTQILTDADHGLRPDKVYLNGNPNGNPNGARD